MYLERVTSQKPGARDVKEARRRDDPCRNANLRLSTPTVCSPTSVRSVIGTVVLNVLLKEPVLLRRMGGGGRGGGPAEIMRAQKPRGSAASRRPSRVVGLTVHFARVQSDPISSEPAEHFGPLASHTHTHTHMYFTVLQFQHLPCVFKFCSSLRGRYCKIVTFCLKHLHK